MSEPLIKFLKKPYLSYIIILTAFAGCLFYYYQYRYDFTCGDLAFRVAASKNMAEGKDAYYYVDSGGAKIVNSVVSTPFINFLSHPLAAMQPCSIKETWFWIEFGCFAGCLIFIFWLTTDPWKRYLQSLCLAVFFLASRYWYFHLASGQIYILYTLFLFGLYFLKVKKLDFLFGFALVVAITCRPLFFMPASLLVIFYLNKRILTGLLTGGVCMLLFVFATHSFAYWLQYSNAMRYYAEQVPLARRNGKVPGAVHFKNYAIVPPNIYNNCKIPVAETTIYHTAPGLTRGLLRPLQSYFITCLNLVVMNVAVFSFIASVLSVIVVFFTKRKYPQIPPEKYMMLFFIVYLIAEICTPAPRLPYNFVFWIFGSALVIAKGSYIETAIIFIALAVNYIQPNSIIGKETTELLMLVACFLFLFRGKKNATTIEGANTGT